MTLRLPAGALVVLIGPSGSGKSTLAQRHFPASGVLSSDALRAMVADDPNDQSATDDAFALLHQALEMRMARGRLTVVDATNVDRWARAPLVSAARRHRRKAVAVVLDLPLALCLARNPTRLDRRLPPAAIRRQHARMGAGLDGLGEEGFGAIVVLSTPEAVDAFGVEMEPPAPEA